MTRSVTFSDNPREAGLVFDATETAGLEAPKHMSKVAERKAKRAKNLYESLTDNGNELEESVRNSFVQYY
ncbi:MAG: hypothetical protein V4649_19115 [Bacteroidota bacterium]